eukprot:1323003-Rhodomonas_salina.1
MVATTLSHLSREKRSGCSRWSTRFSVALSAPTLVQCVAWPRPDAPRERHSVSVSPRAKGKAGSPPPASHTRALSRSGGVTHPHDPEGVVVGVDQGLDVRGPQYRFHTP